MTTNVQANAAGGFAQDDAVFHEDGDEREFAEATAVHRRRISGEQIKKFEGYVAEIFAAFGMDLNTPATKATPQRYIKALYDVTGGYDGDPKLLKVFHTECRDGPDCRLSQVIEGPIKFFSLCEHHALPFFGDAYVGYIAHEQIIGISKLTRLVRLCAKRFTVQERIGQQIADTMEAMLHPHGTAVYLEAHHLCTQMRGVEAQAPKTRTTFWRGAYDTDPALRSEFFVACGLERMKRLAPLQTLTEIKHGRALPLPAKLARAYGRLRMPAPGTRPHIISNFVTTLDGVVSLNVRGHSGGGDISGFNRPDRMVMGLLRACADAVIVGAGTLRAYPQHVWTAERIFPALADEYRELRASLGKREPPLNVIVSASGKLDLRLPVFAAGEVPALIVTTAAGQKMLHKQKLPDSLMIRAVRGKDTIRARSVLSQIAKSRASRLILVEGGPQLLADFYAQQVMDEQFLTLAPQIAGRDDASERPGLVMGQTFAPRDPLWGTLADVRRGGSHLFLRYTFP